MENVVKMRRYRTLAKSESQFLPSNTSKNLAFANNDLAKSGLTLDDIEADAPGMLPLPSGASAGYVIPYYHLDGRPIVNNDNLLVMQRTKFDYPPGVKGPRYLGPGREQLAKHGLPTSIPYVPPQIHNMESQEIICAEGEKKTASIIKLLNLPAFGIGGCQMWRDPDGSGRPHPWILQLLRSRDIKSIIIVPDGDIQRYDISTAYGTFAASLSTEGFEVQILDPRGKIDDLLVDWGNQRRANWDNLSRRSPSDMVVTSKSLIPQYSLAFKTDAKGNPIVHQNTSNITRLLENHPAFPPIWLNNDTNRVMIGDEEMVPESTDMNLANYFQHNLGFDKAAQWMLRQCIINLSKVNNSSPFLEQVRATVWDEKPRLDTWMIDHWGMTDTEFCREVASKWLISACARLHEPGTKLDWMLIVIGPQGTGKTTMPNIVFKGNNTVIYGESNDKDFHMKLHSSLCAGFDELDSFSRRESSMLKAMITTSEDMFRPPYGAATQAFPRRFTLYGCGNSSDFLNHDPSGYRRYAILECPQLLDFKALKANIDQIWAEAWWRYTQKQSLFWKVEGTSAIAENYVAPNLFEEVISRRTQHEMSAKQANNVKDGMLWVTMTMIIEWLGIDISSSNAYKTKELSGILKKIGYEHTGVTRGPNNIKQRWYRIAIVKEE